MEKRLLLAFVCTAFSKGIARCRYGIFENQLQVSISAQDSAYIVDLRDLLKSKRTAEALRGTQTENVPVTPKLKLQYKMYDFYENALLKIQHSVDDCFFIHCDRIYQKMTNCEGYEDFVKKEAVVETLNYTIPFECEIIDNVFQLLNGWCDKIILQLNEVNIPQILACFDYLKIDHERLEDVIFSRDGAPVHLRMKTIDLFCINFVYLLKTQGLLEKYRSFITETEKLSVDKAFNKGPMYKIGSEEARIADLIKRIGPMASYICLLQINMQDRLVRNLYLGSDSTYFVYGLLYEENCECIRLLHKNDFDETLSKLDLIVELNIINNPMLKRKLDILLPFSENHGYKQGRHPIVFTTSSFLSFYCYTHFMGIFNEVQEVCIRNLLYFSERNSISNQIEEYTNGLLVDTVVTAIKRLPGLNSLFIHGFDRFPRTLIPILRNTQLKKFGAMSNCAKVDFLVNYQLFNEECPLKKSISHFMGHWRSLFFVAPFLEKNQIKEATVTSSLTGLAIDFYDDDEKALAEKIRKYFVDGDLQKSVILIKHLKIDTVYFMDRLFTPCSLNTITSRPLPTGDEIFSQSCRVVPEAEIIERCSIKNLIMCNDSPGGSFLEQFMCVNNKPETIETIEVLMNDNDWNSFKHLQESYDKNIGNSNSCLILNINANRFLDKQIDSRVKHLTASDLYFLIRFIAVKNKKTIVIRLRQKGSANNIKESLMRNFEKYFEIEYADEDLDLRNRLRVEISAYNVDDESTLKA
ncbi:hypothetical protein ENBRE01_2790, partial [Enteropsectra breve]